MFKNYLTIALRNLWRHKGFSLLNIAGLAVGLTAGFLTLLYVSFELSYDSFHSKVERIYRVVADIKTPTENIEASTVAWAVLPNMTNEFPEIEASVRIRGTDMLVRKNDMRFEESNVIAAEADFFEIFDFNLTQGDPKLALKVPYSLVLSATSAKKYFGEENPIGQTLKIIEEATITEIIHQTK